MTTYDFPTLPVGAAGSTLVLYVPATGIPGLQAAQALLTRVEALNAQCAAWFGIPMQGVTVVISPISGLNNGSGGAYHYGCTFATGGVLYLDAAVSPAMEAFLYVAELSECFMGEAGRGWICNGSNGEALSLTMGWLVSGSAGGASGGSGLTAPIWARNGAPDWVSRTLSSDQNAIANGCGRAYLSWVLSLGYDMAQVAQAGGATLADNYATLTGKSAGDAYPDLMEALRSLLQAKSDPFRTWPDFNPSI